MGWSATMEACNTLDRITKICIAETGAQNTFVYKGNLYMWETGREQDDGSITGSIIKLIDNGIDEQGYKRYSGYEAGSLKINADGSIERFLRFKRELMDKRCIK